MKLTLSNTGNSDDGSDLLSSRASNQRAKTALLFASGALLYWAAITLVPYFSGLNAMRLSPFFVGAAGYFLGFRAGALASVAAVVVHTVVFNELGYPGPFAAFQVNPALHIGILLLGPMAGHLRTVLRRLQIESQIRQAAAGSHEALWIVTADRSQVLYVNPAFDDVFGIPTDYIFENPGAMQDVVHPDDRPVVEESLASVPEEGRRFEYRIVRFDGAVRWIETTISRVRGNKGRIVGVSRDVTRRKYSAAEQSGRNRVLEKLATGASLLDALTALATSIEETLPDSICSITLVDNETGRVYSGAFPGLPEGFVELSDGLEPASSVSCAGHVIETGNRLLVTNLGESDFDERYIEQAAAAGIHACWSEPIRSPRGGILGALTLYLNKPVAPTDRDGDLLASAANIAAIAIEHKQSEVALKETGGIMIFNEILAAAADDREPAPPPVEPAAEASRGFKTVMVATDELSVRTTVCEFLREKGCRVLRAGEGEEAIALAGAGEEDIDLLITDLVMPRMNGRDLAAELRRTNTRLKVLYISGYIGKASVRIAELGPGTSFLSKPFSPESLARKVRLLLDTAPAEPVGPTIDTHAT